MKEKKSVIYMVTYADDDNKRHIAFVKNFSSVRFLEDRFGKVTFEKTETYTRSETIFDYD